MGVYTSLFTLIWISVYTLPQFNTIIHIDKQVSTTQVLFVYFVVTVANALHSWSYYELIELTGNVNILAFFFAANENADFLNRWRRVFCKA